MGIDIFRYTGPNNVISDAGFSVRRTSRTELLYQENEFFLSIEVEPGEGLAVYLSAAAKSNAIDEFAFAKIKQRVESALKFMGVNYVVV
jgi:hypothetical protein